MFAGCIEFGSTTLGDQLRMLHQASEGLAGIPYDTRAIHSSSVDGKTITLAQQTQWNTPESKLDSNITEDPATGVRVLGWARIDNRDDLNRQLHQSGLSDNRLILLCYLKWGVQLAERIIGDFAIGIWDPRDGSTTLIRDHMGVRPLYYFVNPESDQLIFATSISIIKDLASEQLKTSDKWMARYISLQSEDWESTAYEQVKKVSPAHRVRIQNGQIDSEPYFEFDPTPNLEMPSDQHYVDAYRAILDEALRCRMRTDYPISCELSGGLDSSSVTALAALLSTHCNQKSDPKHGQKSDQKFGQKPGAIGAIGCSMEFDYINLVADFCQIDKPKLVRSDRPNQGMGKAHTQRFERIFGTACENHTAIDHIPFYEIAADSSARTLLSGFGGDEFVTNNATMAQMECWLDRRYKHWFKSFPGNHFTRPLRALKWVLTQILNLNSLLPAKETEGSLAQATLNKGVTIEQPNRVPISECKSINEFILNNRWSPAVTTRLENCTLLAASYGLEYRWPLLDIRLINFYLSVPGEQKFDLERGGGMGRYLHRRAVRGLLPNEIIWKNKSMGAELPESREPNIDFIDFFRGWPQWEDLHPKLRPLLHEKTFNRRMAEVRRTSDKQDWDLVPQCIDRILTLHNWLSENEPEAKLEAVDQEA